MSSPRKPLSVQCEVIYDAGNAGEHLDYFSVVGSHLNSVVEASSAPSVKRCESGLLLPLSISSIWSLDVVLVLLMRLANH